MERSTITKTALSQRPGWSPTLITRLLGEPDQRKKVAGMSNPLALYELGRVEQAEASPEFQAAQAALERRKQAAAQATATKTERLLAAVAAMPVSVQRMSLAAVRARAIARYNQREWSEGASASDDPVFLDRITVNYIRHELTQYDGALVEVAGQTGIQQAVDAIRARVYEAIADAYPMLADECTRQLERKRLERSLMG